MEMNSKRKRTENFTKSEEIMLIEIVKKYSKIVECKKTDSLSNKEKNAVWIKIAQDFNSNSQTYRSSEALKTKYLNLKKQCKKNYAEEKKQQMGTGGGPCLVPKISSVDEEIREILGSQVTGLSSHYDNDAEENSERFGNNNASNNVEWYELTESGNIKEINAIPEFVGEDDSDDYVEESRQGVIKTNPCFDDDKSNESQDDDILVTLVHSIMSQNGNTPHKEPNNCYNKDSQWKVLKKPISNVLKPVEQKGNGANGVSSLNRNEAQCKKTCRPDPLKQKLAKWADSKSGLIVMQKKHCEEEHKKRMLHLDKKYELELHYMKMEHEARMEKLLNPKEK